MAKLYLGIALMLAGCSTGDFCDLYEPVRFERPVAEFVVQHDRAAAVAIDKNNRVEETQCR